MGWLIFPNNVNAENDETIATQDPTDNDVVAAHIVLKDFHLKTTVLRVPHTIVDYDKAECVPAVDLPAESSSSYSDDCMTVGGCLLYLERIKATLPSPPTLPTRCVVFVYIIAAFLYLPGIVLATMVSHKDEANLNVVFWINLLSCLLPLFLILGVPALYLRYHRVTFQAKWQAAVQAAVLALRTQLHTERGTHYDVVWILQGGHNNSTVLAITNATAPIRSSDVVSCTLRVIRYQSSGRLGGGDGDGSDIEDLEDGDGTSNHPHASSSFSFNDVSTTHMTVPLDDIKLGKVESTSPSLSTWILGGLVLVVQIAVHPSETKIRTSLAWSVVLSLIASQALVWTHSLLLNRNQSMGVEGLLFSCVCVMSSYIVTYCVLERTVKRTQRRACQKSIAKYSTNTMEPHTGYRASLLCISGQSPAFCLFPFFQKGMVDIV